MRFRTVERTGPRFRGAPRVGPAVRRVLARRPWIRHTVTASLAGAAGLIAWSALQDVERARASWVDTRTVVVADGDHATGDLLRVRHAELPVAVVPSDAIEASEVTEPTRVTQRLADGEPVVRFDLAGVGPGGLAPDGTVVVAVFDPLMPTAALGSRVSVYAEGVVLAEEGRVVAVTDVAILVAVADDDAPLVAAAAHARTAALVFPS